MDNKTGKPSKVSFAYNEHYLKHLAESEKFEKEYWKEKYRKSSRENAKWIIATGTLAILNILQVIL